MAITPNDVTLESTWKPPTVDAEPAAQGAFSLELSQDQKDIREWVHGFAEGVVRPAAAEWDEREETPWPIIQEAAKIGLYGFEGLAQFYADPTGITLSLVNEELFWGDAGIGMSIMGTTLAVASIFSAGTAEQLGEWVPQCYGTPEDPTVGSFCVSEPDAGSDVSSLRTRATYDEAKDEWVLNGQKAWATNGGIAAVHVVVASVDKELGSRGQAAFVIPPGTKGLEMGTKVKKHGIRASHTADVFLDDCRIPGSCLLGGKEKLDERLARTREGTRAKSQAAMQTFEVSRPTVGAQALGIARAAYEFALDYAKEREQFGKKIIENQAIAFTLADMKMEIDCARLLVWRASWMGKAGSALHIGRGLDEQAQGRRGCGLGHREGDTDPRRQRLHPRVPGRAHAPRREDLHDLRGHLGDPAAGDQPGHLGHADPIRRASFDVLKECRGGSCTPVAPRERKRDAQRPSCRDHRDPDGLCRHCRPTCGGRRTQRLPGQGDPGQPALARRAGLRRHRGTQPQARHGRCGGHEAPAFQARRPPADQPQREDHRHRPGAH